MDLDKEIKEAKERINNEKTFTDHQRRDLLERAKQIENKEDLRKLNALFSKYQTDNAKTEESTEEVKTLSTQDTTSNISKTVTVDAESSDEIEEAEQRKKDFEQYVSIAKITGSLTKDPAEFTLQEQKEFEANFYQWVRQGKPLPSMPKSDKAKIAAPVDIFLVKIRGKLMMYHDTDTEDGKQVGKVGNDYTQTYDEKLLQQWIREQEELNGPQQRTHCYIILDGVPHTVHPDALFKYEETATEIKKGTYHY